MKKSCRKRREFLNGKVECKRSGLNGGNSGWKVVRYWVGMSDEIGGWKDERWKECTGV